MCMNSGFSILRHSLELLTRNVILSPLYFMDFFLQFIQVETDRGYM